MATPTAPMRMDVLIVGCGIAGLTAAVACREKGFNVMVLESLTEFSHVGAGLMISSNASRILCDMGLREPLDACGIHMKRVIFVKHDNGTTLNDQTYYDTEAQLGAPLWLIHRADLHNVLLAKAQGLGVKITMGAKVKSFDWDAPNALLEDGTVVTADVILAADGYRSRARGEMLGQYEEPRFSGTSAYRALIHRSAFENDPQLKPLMNVENQTTYVWVGEGCHILGYPIRQGEFFNLVSTQPAVHTKGSDFVVQVNPSEVINRYKHWDAKLVAILKNLPKENVLEWKLCDLEPMKSWIFPGGKIILLGDASHAMLPSAAQGASMGIEDGAAIAELLARASDREQIPAILKTFESLRLPRCTYVVDTGRLNAKKWHGKDAKGGTDADEVWEYDIKSAAKSMQLEAV